MLNKLNKKYCGCFVFVQQLLQIVKTCCWIEADFFVLLESFELQLPMGRQGQWRCSEQPLKAKAGEHA